MSPMVRSFGMPPEESGKLERYSCFRQKGIFLGGVEPSSCWGEDPLTNIFWSIANFGFWRFKVIFLNTLLSREWRDGLKVKWIGVVVRCDVPEGKSRESHFSILQAQ